MRYLLMGVFLVALISQEDVRGQEGRQSSWYPIISLKYGFNYGGTSDDFFKTYNRYNSFPRPLLISETSWQDYKAPDRRSTLAAETGITIHNRSSLGIAIQHYGFDATDEFVYTGIVEYSTGETIQFPNTTEQHQFKSNVTHVLAFFDYRIFEKSPLSPAVGLGIGFTFSSFEWNWTIDGRTLINNNTILHLTDDQTFLNIENKRNFAVQPRFRLDYSFPGSGFFNSVFLQTDYIFSKYDADYFKRFRDLALEGQPFESLPQSLRTDDIKMLYEDYAVNTGGFELMVGLTLRFNIPDRKQKENAQVDDFEPLSEKPEIIEQVGAKYPLSARKKRIEGRVVVKILINTKGNVENVEVIKSPDSLLSKAAVEAARQWKFTPGRQEGKPVKVWMTIPFDFKLKGVKPEEGAGSHR